jgi:hypothetical protein
MKSIWNLALFGALLQGLAACAPNPDETTFSYPFRFVFQGYEFEAPQYFKINADGSSEAVQPSAALAAALEPEVEEFASGGLAGIITALEFLSEDEIAVNFLLLDDSSSVRLVYAYAEQGGRLLLEDGAGSSFSLDKDADFERLSYCQLVYGYTYFDSAAQSYDYGPFDVLDCPGISPTQLADELAVDAGLIPGDTLMIARYFLVFERE